MDPGLGQPAEHRWHSAEFGHKNDFVNSVVEVGMALPPFARPRGMHTQRNHNARSIRPKINVNLAKRNLEMYFLLNNCLLIVYLPIAVDFIVVPLA